MTLEPVDKRHSFEHGGRVIDTMPPVHYCTCGRVKSDPIHINAVSEEVAEHDKLRREIEQLRVLLPPKDQPWLLALPGGGSQEFCHGMVNAVREFCVANDCRMPLIVFGKLSEISALDKEEMREHGWVRA